MGLGSAALLVFGTFVSISFLVFFLYLGRRAWRIDQEYRSLAGQALGLTKMPTSRLWVGRVAWAAAFFYALVLIGTSAFNFYSSVIIFLNMPRSVAVITSSTGAGITASPAEWNAHAWKLATDHDPSARNPIEAVRLAEQTVASDPKNGDYVKTLGVARYRAGDLAGSIEALNRSVEWSGTQWQRRFLPGDGSSPARPPRRGPSVVSECR